MFLQEGNCTLRMDRRDQMITEKAISFLCILLKAVLKDRIISVSIPNSIFIIY